jgi:pimeloyl-ACP methyl ester carboxylesterase
MAEFVLVAGAFHGAWAWEAVAALLDDQGHSVHSLDLTGQGSRHHDANSETGLSTHIMDVEAYVRAEQLHDVILVGHSYSGMVITGAADRLGSQIAHLVYLDAMVPQDGQSATDIAGPAMTAAAVEATGDGWETPFFLPVSKFGPFADDAQEQWLLSRLGTHPLKAFFEPIALTQSYGGQRSFIYCAGDPLGIFDIFAEAARASDAWGYYEVPTGHDPMITLPATIAHLLDVIANGDQTAILKSSSNTASPQPVIAA